MIDTGFPAGRARAVSLAANRIPRIPPKRPASNTTLSRGEASDRAHRGRSVKYCALFSLLFACATTPRPPAATPPLLSQAPPPSPALFQPAIQRMIAPGIGAAPFAIRAIAGPVKGWAAVAISPPYREFPTIVLFHAAEDGSWRRVFEGLTPGVQPQRSALLDLHTKGEAIDYAVGGEGSLVTRSVIETILSLSTSQELVTVAHAYFLHAHPAGQESYFVDRTATYELARRFFPGEYEKYPRTNCTMFDVPAIREVALDAEMDRLVLTAVTDNAQTWVISWRGVDERGLLTDKITDAH